MMDPRTQSIALTLAGLSNSRDGIQPVVAMLAAILQLQDFEPAVALPPSLVVFQRWRYKTKLEARLVLLVHSSRARFSLQQLAEMDNLLRRVGLETGAHLVSYLFVFLDAQECWLWGDSGLQKGVQKTYILEALYLCARPLPSPSLSDRAFQQAFFTALFSRR
jgi:hypothetical protein